MKLPALCLAATFAGGVALGMFSPLVHLSASALANRGALFLVLTLLAVSVVLLRKNRIALSATLSLGAWLSLG